MPCDCAKYPAIKLDRKSIKRRMKESAAIQARLATQAEHPELKIALYRCPDCGQRWQSGWEWNMGGQIYLFQVPAIEVAEWQREPYAQPGAMMIYSAVMRDYFARNNFEPGEGQCRAEGCMLRAIRHSVLCRDHHIESLQQVGLLTKKPVGRLFPPYYVESQNAA